MTTEIKLRADQRAAGACLYATSRSRSHRTATQCTASPDLGTIPCNSSTARSIRLKTT